MFIDEIDHKTCWSVWTRIQFNPIKTARLMFPKRPEGYVRVAKLVKAYLANKGTALGLPNDKVRSPRIKMYTGIAADIYVKIPAWGRSINIDFLNEEDE